MFEFFKGEVTRKDWAFVAAVMAITAALIALFVFFVRSAQLAKLENIRSENEKVVTELRLAEERQRKIDELRQEAQRYQQIAEEFEKRLPSTAEIATLVTEIENLGRQARISDVKMKDLPRTVDQTKMEIPYTIEVAGSYHQIADFINRLERYKRYLKVSSLSIGEQENGISIAKFILSTYRLMKPAAGAEAPAGGGASAQAAQAGGETL